MGSSNGYRRKTRKLFSKDFRKHGAPHIGRTIQQFKMGDYVDCVVDPSVVKGMPHKSLHGRTGVVFNCNPRSYGVIFFRKMRGMYIEKQVHLRVEHLRMSRCREEDLKRRAEYAERVAEAKEKGVKTSFLKRQPEGPREAITILKKGNTPVEISAKPFVSFY